jgi:uncharacterized protein
VPAILIFTPYYRRFALRADAPAGTEASPGVARWRDLFVPRGYALVAVDVRGTGASFGTRDSFRSPRERDDYARIADWVVAQPFRRVIRCVRCQDRERSNQCRKPKQHKRCSCST